MGDGEFSECTWTLSALEALRNALYKFKTYLLTYLLMSHLQQNSAQLIASARGPPKPNLVQIHPLGASGYIGEI